MKYINVFETQSEFDNAKSGLERPLLSYVTENDKVYILSEAKPLITKLKVYLDNYFSIYNMMVGATCCDTKESWYGYYSWGEIEEKQSYDASNYKWYTGHQEGSNWVIDSVDKYNNTDEYTQLQRADDPGSYNGSEFNRSPRESDITKLFDTTIIDHEWKTDYMGVSGLNGMLFTSKIEGLIGNHIFIPATGKRDATLSEEGESIYLWTNVRDTDDSTCQKAIGYKITSSGVDKISQPRHIGMGILEVQDFV